jgi:tetratricopeptide (TPR) repeat protein
LAPLQSQGEIYVQIVNLLSQDHNPAALEKFCREILQRNDLIQNPQFSAYFQRHLAIALARLGEDKLALAAADKAIAQSGGNDRLGYRLVKADILGMASQWDDAIVLCKKLLEEFPGPADRVRIRYLLSSIYWGAKKRAEAEAELRGILDADPDHAGACNNLGFFLSEQGRNLDEAERLIRRAIAVDRADRRKSGEVELESAAYLDSLAWVLFRKEKLAEARSLLEKAAVLPDGASDGTVLDHLGDVRYRLGEKEKAHAAWEEAERFLTVDPRGKRDGRLEEVRRKLKRLP